MQVEKVRSYPSMPPWTKSTRLIGLSSYFRFCFTHHSSQPLLSLSFRAKMNPNHPVERTGEDHDARLGIPWAAEFVSVMPSRIWFAHTTQPRPVCDEVLVSSRGIEITSTLFYISYCSEREREWQMGVGGGGGGEGVKKKIRKAKAREFDVLEAKAKRLPG